MPLNILYYQTQNKITNIINFYAFFTKKQNIYLKIIKLILLQKKNL